MGGEGRRIVNGQVGGEAWANQSAVGQTEPACGVGRQVGHGLGPGVIAQLARMSPNLSRKRPPTSGMREPSAKHAVRPAMWAGWLRGGKRRAMADAERKKAERTQFRCLLNTLLNNKLASVAMLFSPAERTQIPLRRCGDRRGGLLQRDDQVGSQIREKSRLNRWSQFCESKPTFMDSSQDR